MTSLSSSEFSREIVGNHTIIEQGDLGFGHEFVFSAIYQGETRFFSADEEYANWEEVSRETANELAAKIRNARNA